MTTPLRVGIQGSDDTAAAFEALDRRIRRVESSTKSWTQSLSQLSQLTRNVVAGFRSMVSGVEAILAPSQKLVGLEVQLAASLAKSGKLTDENYKSLIRFASARADVTLFSREVSLRMATIGAEFGLTTEQIGQAIEAVQDRSLQLGRDPIDLFRGYAKALAGIGNEWTELGLKVDQSADRHTKFTQTLKQMRSGISEAIAELPTSAFTRLGLRIGEIADGLGRVIVSTRTFQSVMGMLHSFAKSLRGALGDPAAIARIALAIDAFVQKVVQSMAYGASVVVRVTGTVVAAIEDIRETIKGFLNAGEIARLREEYEKLWIATDTGAERSAEVKDKLAGLSAHAALLAGRSSDLGRELLRTADSLEEFSRKATIFSGPLQALAGTVNAIVQSFQSIPAEVWDNQAASLQALVAQAQADREKLVEENRAWGTAMADAFSTAFQRAFDRDVGMRQAFRDLGGDVVSVFTGQFGDAAFDPLKASFGELAKALAAPFRVVGNVIAGVLSPITSLISNAITYLIESFASMIGLQVSGAATSAGIMAGLATQISATAYGWGAAAVAASIATVGGALSVVPETMGAIGAGAGLTAALVVPKAAEGAFVEPRPGGTIVRVAEAGQAEVIAPMPKLEASIRRALGGMGSGLSINLNGPMEFGTKGTASEIAEEIAGQLALRAARDRSFRGGMF